MARTRLLFASRSVVTVVAIACFTLLSLSAKGDVNQCSRTACTGTSTTCSTALVFNFWSGANTVVLPPSVNAATNLTERPPDVCQTGFEAFDGRCYAYSLGKFGVPIGSGGLGEPFAADWNTAEDICSKPVYSSDAPIGGCHLVSIHTLRENCFIHEIIKGHEYYVTTQTKLFQDRRSFNDFNGCHSNNFSQGVSGTNVKGVCWLGLDQKAGGEGIAYAWNDLTKYDKRPARNQGFTPWGGQSNAASCWNSTTGDMKSPCAYYFEPNNIGGGTEDCALIWDRDGTQGEWNDEPCSYSYPYVCSKLARCRPGYWRSKVYVGMPQRRNLSLVDFGVSNTYSTGTCTECAAGTYHPQSALANYEVACFPCPGGTFGEKSANSSLCSGTCPAGYYCPAGTKYDNITACPQDSFSAAGASACQPCAEGEISTPDRTGCMLVTLAPTPPPAPTEQPSRSPTSEAPSHAPSQSPSRSPTVFCPAGTFSASGFGRNNGEDCILCPAGGYESITEGTVDRTSCQNITCAETFWCGPGAVEEVSYRKLVTHTNVLSTIVVGSIRTFNISVVPVTGSTEDLNIWVASAPPGVSITQIIDGNSLHFNTTTSAQGLELEVVANSDEFDNNNAPDPSLYDKVIVFNGWIDGDPTNNTFTVRISFRLQLVSVVVTPSNFQYQAVVGKRYARGHAALSSAFRVDVLNPLCSSTLIFAAHLSLCKNGNLSQATLPWLNFEDDSIRDGSIPPSQGVSSVLDFIVDLRHLPLLPTNASEPAALLTACIVFEMELPAVGIRVERSVAVSVMAVQKCPPGHFSATGGNEAGCLPCAKNTFQPQSGSFNCAQARAGREVSANASAEIVCKPGRFSSADNPSCMPCPLHTYTSESASTLCVSCPDDLPATLREGANSRSDCSTNGQKNTFKHPDGSALPCPKGAMCNFPGATPETLVILPGFFRLSPTSLEIRPCPQPQFCRPTSHSSASDNRRILQEGNVTTPSVSNLSLCSPNHEGIMCETCAAGYAHRGLEKFCELCTQDTYGQDAGRVSGLLLVAILGIAFLGYFTIKLNYENFRDKKAEASSSDQKSRAVIAATDAAAKTSSRCGRHDVCSPFKLLVNSPLVRSWLTATSDVLGVPVKIALGYVQVISGMAVGLSDDLPEYFQDLAKFFSFLSFDLVAMFDFGCAVPDQTHFSSLIMATTLPLGGFLVLYAIEHLIRSCCCSRRRDKDNRRALHIGFVRFYIWVIIFIYPAVSKTILKTFACENFENGSSWLSFDHRVSCQTSTYTFLFVYAVIAVIVYVAGIPAVILYTLYQQRHELNLCPEGGDSTKISLAFRDKLIDVQSTRTLWDGYRPGQYWFEAFEFLRKLLQTSIFVFVTSNDGSPSQILFLLLICAFSIVIFGGLDPYIHGGHNALAQWTQWAIFVIAFGALLNRMEVNSSSTKPVLDGLLMFCLVSVPLFAFLLTIHDSIFDRSKKGSVLSWLYSKLTAFYKRLFRNPSTTTVQTSKVQNDEESAPPDQNQEWTKMTSSASQVRSDAAISKIRRAEVASIFKSVVGPPPGGSGMVVIEPEEADKAVSDILRIFEQDLAVTVLKDSIIAEQAKAASFHEQLVLLRMENVRLERLVTADGGNRRSSWLSVAYFPFPSLRSQWWRSKHAQNSNNNQPFAVEAAQSPDVSAMQNDLGVMPTVDTSNKS